MGSSSSQVMLFLLLLIASFSSRLPTAAADDRDALLEVKNSLVDPLGQLSSWTSSVSFCRWQGVTCAEGTDQVTALRLPNSSLQGTLSPALGRLASLQELLLYSNNLTGAVPEAIGNCSSLTLLDAKDNSLDGSLPRSLGLLKRLTRLRLSGNRLTGSIPEEIANSTSLKHLELYNNQLQGPIPPLLGRLQQLTHLSLQENKLTGGIPKELGDLRLLNRLELFENSGLQGELPRDLGKLSRLRFFSASNCNLTGTLPPELANMTSLTELDLSSNRISGSLGEEYGRKWRNLRTLNLSMNNLSGSVPAAFGGLSNLIEMDLSFNNFTGTVPASIGLLPNVTKLLISSNGFTGSLPPAFGKLAQFNASNNKFFGRIPAGFCSRDNLTTLSIANNNLNGTLEALGGCSALRSVEASNNDFSGEIPSFTSASLAQLDLSTNQLQGRIPQGIDQLKKLQFLRLSDNQLEGEIPVNIGQLTQLAVLDLSHNRFDEVSLSALTALTQLQTLDLSVNSLSGQIPANLGQELQMLETLDLSNNNFSGPIPESLGTISGLQKFNFSSNNFSGSIPQVAAFSQAANAFLDNPGLCGFPLAPCSIPPNSAPPPQRMGHGRRNAGRKVGVAFVVVAGTVLSAGAIYLFCSHRALNKKKSARVQENRFADRVPIMYAEAQKATEGFNEEHIIGVGPHGTVYKGIYAWEKILAVKVLHTQQEADDRGHFYFNAAARKLSRIRHPHVVRLEGFIMHSGSRIFLYEYMPNKSLGEVLHAVSGPKLGWNTRYKIALGAAQGLSYLHQNSIIHCDVKSNNVMLDAAFGAHIGDIGIAKLVKDPSNLAAVDRTFGYAAPEAMRVSLKADVYSFGIVLFELLTGKEPVLIDGTSIATWVRNAIASDQPLSDIVDPLLRNSNGPFYEEMSIVCKVALACTDPQPNRRPGMKEVVDVLNRVRRDPPKLRSLQSFIHRRSFILLGSDDREEP